MPKKKRTSRNRTIRRTNRKRTNRNRTIRRTNRKRTNRRRTNRRRTNRKKQRGGRGRSRARTAARVVLPALALGGAAAASGGLGLIPAATTYLGAPTAAVVGGAGGGALGGTLGGLWENATRRREEKRNKGKEYFSLPPSTPPPYAPSPRQSSGQELMSKPTFPDMEKILQDFQGIAEKFGESEERKFATLAADIINTKSLGDLLRNKSHLVFGIVKLNEIQLFLKHLSSKEQTEQTELLSKIHVNLGNSRSSLTISDIMTIISHMETIMNYAWDFDGELTELIDMSLLTNTLQEMTRGSSESRSRNFHMKGAGRNRRGERRAAPGAGGAGGAIQQAEPEAEPDAAIAAEEVICCICHEPVDFVTDPNLCPNEGHNCHLNCYLDWFRSRKEQEANGYLRMPAGKSCFNCPLCQSNLDPERDQAFLSKAQEIESRIRNNEIDHEFAAAVVGDAGRARQIIRWIAYLILFVGVALGVVMQLEAINLQLQRGDIFGRVATEEEYQQFIIKLIAMCVCYVLFILLRII